MDGQEKDIPVSVGRLFLQLMSSCSNGSFFWRAKPNQEKRSFTFCCSFQRWQKGNFFFLWKCVCRIGASLLLLPVLMWRREGKVTSGQSVSVLESCLLWRGRLLVLQQLLGNMGQITWERNWSIPVNNSRINNYFTAVLSQAARVSQLCISHAPWPQPQGLLSRVWGFFGLGNQACPMKQFVRGQLRKPIHTIMGGRRNSLCREGEGCEQVQDAVSACCHPAAQHCPAWRQQRGSSLHHRGLVAELPQVLHGEGNRCPGGGHWGEPSSSPLQMPGDP